MAVTAFLDTSVLLAGLIHFGPQSTPANLILNDVALGKLTASTAWHCCLEWVFGRDPPAARVPRRAKRCRTAPAQGDRESTDRAHLPAATVPGGSTRSSSTRSSGAAHTTRTSQPSLAPQAPRSSSPTTASTS